MTKSRYLEQVTAICLEVPWTDDFGPDGHGFSPSDTIRPYIEALSINSGLRMLHRSVHTEEDWKRWTAGLHGKHLGRRILWVSAHGDKEINGEGIALSLLSPVNQSGRVKKGIRQIPPKAVNSGLKEAGALEGIIIDACEFGKNTDEWLTGVNAMWALVYSKTVGWTESTFFSIKVLEWLYEKGPIESSDEAAQNFKRGVETGREKANTDKVDFTGLATALGAKLFVRKGKGWYVGDWPALR